MALFGRWRHWVRPMFVVATAAGLILVGGVGLLFRQAEAGLPAISAIVDYHSPAGQAFVPMAAIPPAIVHAFLAAEDNDFFSHRGVNLLMTLRAIGLDIARYGSGRHPIGASTITQQLVKNLIVGDEISLDRKIKEALIALRIERSLTKNQILEIYLNQVYLGCRSHGVEMAALDYFGKPLSEVTIVEAAFLAGLPRRRATTIHRATQMRRLAGAIGFSIVWSRTATYRPGERQC